MDRQHDDRSVLLAILAFLIWPLGLFLYLWWQDSKPARAESLKIGLIFAFGAWVIGTCSLMLAQG